MARRRPLTPGEIALAREAFGDRIRYDAVRLSDGAGINPIPLVALRSPNTDAITLGNTIYFGRNYFGDFSTAHDRAKGLLLHEMTHVWQWAKLGKVSFLTRYLREFLAVDRDAAAMYKYGQNERFAYVRLEAQADMIRHYGLAYIVGDEAKMQTLASHLKGTGFYGL